MEKKRPVGRPPKAVATLEAAGLDIDEIQARFAVKSKGSKLTAQLLVDLIQAGKVGKSVSEFCAEHNLSRKSFYKYLEDASFAEAFEHYKMNIQAYYSQLARLSALEGSGVSASGLNIALKFALGFGMKETHELVTGETVDVKKENQANQPPQITINLAGAQLPVGRISMPTVREAITHESKEYDTKDR